MMRTLLVAYVTAYSTICLAQTAPPQPAFEAAVIKPSKTGDTSTHWHSGKGRVTAENLSLKEMMAVAYRVKDFQITGPAWINDERYVVDAKADSNVDDDKLLPMLQTLLAERFRLVFHRETKEMSAYALVAAKGGMKIHAVEGVGSQSKSGGGKITAKHMSMSKFGDFLSRQLDRPVVDETGTGTDGFDFTLEWSNERVRRAAEADGGVPAGPSLFTALTEQLGLKLETRKVPVEIFAVDKAERPTDN